jgi:hypothetical protein
VAPFFAGLAMVVGGGYLLLNQVTVTSGLWAFWGYNAFGLSLLPLLVGIGIVFFNGKSILGWGLTAAGALIIVAGILVNLHHLFSTGLPLRHPRNPGPPRRRHRADRARNPSRGAETGLGSVGQSVSRLVGPTVPEIAV